MRTLLSAVAVILSIGAAQGQGGAKKGVTCPVDLDDVKALGAAQAAINIQPTHAFLPATAPDPATGFVLEVDGVRLRFDPRWVAQLDTEVSRLTSLGVHVIAIVTCAIPPGADNRHPLVHERCDVVRAPNHLTAFRVNDAAGTAHFTGFLRFCASRFPGIAGYVIGNEIDAHWQWHNLGEASAGDVIAQHARELVLACRALHGVRPALRVFTSLTHSWALPHALSPRRALAARRLLRALLVHDELRALRWDVAYHPYPENLFEPRFWTDRTAFLAQDTPKVTLKNLEVLLDELARDGRGRRVILSEQGFHRQDGDDGDDVQAAAYALAWRRVEAMAGVDAFLLHRHVDHKNEGGLRLGLWSCDPASADPCKPFAKRRMHEVFRAAGTPAFEDVARFALPIVGLGSWDEVVVHEGPVPAHAREWHPWHRDGEGLDLLDALDGAGLDDARLDDALAFEHRFVTTTDGILPGVMLHPKTTRAPGRANVALRAATKPGQLRFAVAKLGEGGDGVRFAVELDGRELWSSVTESALPQRFTVAIPASSSARTLSFVVHARGDCAWDHACWLAPRLVDG
ncbi:MAG: NPCBM/NEW2 domain-containing protein [Planctomycetes bacterium]|nr:NPCBM/NEW2 domain-containing protein [Planctomycetota bacterium]